MADTEDGGPPESCHFYRRLNQVPKEIQKYWMQRYDIFSRYDDGVWLTEEAWYGVTPEPVAERIAHDLARAAPRHKSTLIDVFAGVGGNTIAFARSGRWERIFAIERDPAVLQCAKHNAALYGVENSIWWIEGDCFEVLRKQLANVGSEAVIFGSPPWGGPGYRSDDIFSLATMQPFSLRKLYGAFSKLTRDIALYLPRTSDLNEIAKIEHNQGIPIPAVHYCMRGASKALCVYFGDLGQDHESPNDLESANDNALWESY